MKYRIFTLLLTFSLFATLAKAQDKDLYKVTADQLRVRATSSVDSKITGFIRQGENVMVLDSSNAKFYKVRVTNGEGWVSSDYLTRISPPTIVKKAEPAKPIVLKSTGKDYSKTIFIVLAATVMLTLLFIIFKFMSNKIFIGLATVIILGVAYLFYLAFVVEKSVGGKYTGTEEAQYKYLDFKTNGTVEVQDLNTDSIFSMNYDIEGDIIKFKQEENTNMLLIRDDSTLIGEGFTRGTFKK